MINEFQEKIYYIKQNLVKFLELIIMKYRLRLDNQTMVD